MNWAIRIALILVILGGLLWLNWGRFSEIVSDVEAPYQEAVETAEAPISSNAQVPQDESGTFSDSTVTYNLVETTSPIVVQTFDLQEAPASLDQSDERVRSVAEELSPSLKTWLTPDEQLRKWTSLVKQAAEGKTMYQDRPFNLGLSKFQVETREERLYISPDNFKRYDSVVNVLVALPADKLVAYYRAWYSLWEQAFAELGLPGSFDEQVDSMLNRILAVKIIEQPIELQKPTTVNYKFMDPDLEKASQIEKWLWRMGPENASKIQAFTGRLKQALER